MVLIFFMSTIAKPHVKMLTDGSMEAEPPAAGGYGGLGAKPQPLGDLLVLKKDSCFNAIKSHFARF